jgi:hypothetical protein
VGENTITFQLTGSGSKDGIMYDCIKLEAGQPVISGIHDITIDDASVAKPVKYLHNGRLVIEASGRRYAADGRMIND